MNNSADTQASSRRSPWHNMHLVGDTSSNVAFLCFAGLAANGVVSLKKIARELYRRFDRKVDFWQRNLWGHTGRYGEFRRSRMWRWTLDAVLALRTLLARPNNKHIYLLGHSTGALVAVVTAWLYQNAPRWIFAERNSSRKVNLILIAPAFRLRSRRNTYLLSMILVLYYFICPIVFIAIPFTFHTLWDLVLLTAILFFILLPRVRIPTRSNPEFCDRAEKRSIWSECDVDCVRAFALVVHLAVFPTLILLLALFLPIDVIRPMLWFFVGTIVSALFYLPRGNVLDADWEDEEERSERPAYHWLPVVTAATLIPLQWLSAHVATRIRQPMLVMLLSSDKVVDNSYTSGLFEQIIASDKTILTLNSLPHSDLGQDAQLEIVQVIDTWLQERNIFEVSPAEQPIESGIAVLEESVEAVSVHS